MNRNIRLEGGENYSLSTLFSGDNDKVVIPDLQRDYCWGNEDVNLVGPFIDSLMELDKSQNLTMGLIYGYYDELCPNHLQLCDGQQRLTTLFLTLGVLNRLTQGRYKTLLMSQYELQEDDNEPYLLYSIRESSLYFISDLVSHYFLQTDEKDKKLMSINDITTCPWYLNSYKADPTIASIVSAIITIEEKFLGKSMENLIELGDFISGIEGGRPHIDFLYYDMNNRHNGEETFVVINTTGEPLTANQNLKPVIIEQYRDTIDCIEDKWEEMETWFWQHRDKTEKTHTSDEGMSEFLRCVRLYYADTVDNYVNSIEDKDRFPYKTISFKQIYDLFKAYRRIYELDYTERNDLNVNYNNKNNRGKYTSEQLYSLLPTLRYVMHFATVTDNDIKRFYHIFFSVAKYQNVNNSRTKEGKTDVPIMRAMKVVDDMTDKDVLCLRDSAKLNDQEKSKLSFIWNNLENRELAEMSIVNAENIILFDRRIKTVLDWCDNSIERLDFYTKKIKTLWWGDCRNNIDPLRRALLTCQWNLYPITVENKSHKTLGWEWSQWFTFFTKNDILVKEFLESNLSIDDRIKQFDDTNNPYYSIIKDGKYLGDSLWKNLYDYGKIIILMEKERAQANYCIFMNGIPYPKHELGGGWKTPWRWENLLYCNHTHYDLTIDYLYDEKKGYQVLIWSGKNKSFIPFKSLSEVSSYGFEKCEKGREGWISHYICDVNEAKALAIKVAKWIDSVGN